MSPAYSENKDDIFTWVGVIMYLPPGKTPEQRADITNAFQTYTSLLAPVYEKYNAYSHWAKIEIPPALTEEERAAEVLTGTYLRAYLVLIWLSLVR